MLAHNRQPAASQPARPRNRLGRFTVADAVQGQVPSLVCIAKQIAAEAEISVQSLWNWYRLYCRGGYRALVRKRRADAGIVLRRRPELRPAIDARLSAGLNPFAVWKSLRWACGSDVPCYATVLRYARRSGARQ